MGGSLFLQVCKENTAKSFVQGCIMSDVWTYQGFSSALTSRLHVLPHLIGEGLAQHVLVKGAREVGINEMPVVQSLPHAAAHKFEEVKVVGAAGLIILDHAVGVGLEG